jgi:hypothetical protein
MAKPGVIWSLHVPIGKNIRCIEVPGAWRQVAPRLREGGGT